MNAIHLHRIGRWFYQRRMPFVAKMVSNLIFLLFNSYIPSSASIGKGTVFAYGAIGVVIHADAKIGEGCVIGQGATIGAAEGFVSSQKHACPHIGNHCYLGAGVKLLGGISVGSHCQIGAGTIVLSDLPDHAIAVGVPARVIGHTPADFLAIRS